MSHTPRRPGHYTGNSLLGPPSKSLGPCRPDHHVSPRAISVLPGAYLGSGCFCPLPAGAHARPPAIRFLHIVLENLGDRAGLWDWGTPTCAQCRCSLFPGSSSDSGSKSARPWGVSLLTGFRTPSPTSPRFVDPRDGVGGRETAGGDDSVFESAFCTKLTG